MEKYYCDKCRRIYEKEGNCDHCNIPVTKKIQINIQSQSKPNNHFR